MKLFRFVENGKPKLGFCLNDIHVDMEETAKKAGRTDLPTDLESLFNAEDDMEDVLSEYLELDPEAIDEEGIEFAPMADCPEKILCIGLNYSEHIEETGLTKSNFPPVFCKFNSSLTGHKSCIKLPKDAKEFDYEAELVIMIGKEAKNISVDEAEDYIFGYTAGNDFSARDLQMSTSQWTLGKACDGFAPLGPYLVTSDEIDPDNLRISCKVNGETVQDSTTSHMIFNCAQIVSYLSSYMTLRPGDIIYTGTPSGVILGKADKADKWLKAGDEVTVAIEGIGELTNTLC